MSNDRFRNRPPNKEGCLLDPRQNRVIVLEDMDFLWDRSELNEIVKMWKKGFSVKAMGEYFDRDPDEVLLACIHLSRSERIFNRKCGLGGKG